MGFLDEQPKKEFTGMKMEKTESTNDMSWLDDPKETILLFGSAKCGKTWAYCSIIEAWMKKGGKIYILNTDGGVAKTLRSYFADKVKEVAKRIEYKFISNMDEGMKYVDEIKGKVNSDDLIIFDLVSDCWEMAQNKFLADVSGSNVANYIVRASKNDKKFGMFEGKMWSYVHTFHDYVVKPFTVRAKCTVVGVCSEKDLDIAKAFGGKVQNEYKKIGFRPAGAPRLDYDFNTIVRIFKDMNVYSFVIVGDRGSNFESKNHSYKRNFWEKFQEVRKKEY